VPRYTEKPAADAAGLKKAADLQWELPYNLRPVDLHRMVEDIYDMLHEVNVKLHEMGYDRMEELLDSAGYSGFVSRSAVDRIDRFSKGLVRNNYPNGYPDLLPRGVYAGDRVQHGEQGGLEVKATRSETNWQAHGPRSGWFCLLKFNFDDDDAKALHDREPTVIEAVMVSELSKDDWNWQPAKEGRIRSGTASVKPSGRVKLRNGAVWIDPGYREVHEAQLQSALLYSFAADADELVLALLNGGGEAMAPEAIAQELGTAGGLDPDVMVGRVKSALKRLASDGRVQRVRVGRRMFFRSSS
jgi:hypothetical protein